MSDDVRSSPSGDYYFHLNRAEHYRIRRGVVVIVIIVLYK